MTHLVSLCSAYGYGYPSTYAGAYSRYGYGYPYGYGAYSRYGYGYPY